FIENVNLNPTRLGFYHILQRMGAKISLDVKGQSWGESFGTITTEYSRLRATDVLPKEVPLCLDELPLLALVASQAEGVTRVYGARELRFKESDRLSCTLRELGKLGVKSCEYADGFAIEGPCKLKGGYLQSYGDHRLSMTWGVASALSDCLIDIEGKDCCEVSFPRFWEWII
ncbi:3-phosphoshikimate 1-carboxyvinyltransferase, partial [bacterium]|nr:3-phosphoshikimate 1-carboxyvinyltransferase [bacterium]